ncbi:MAG: SDR family NAD(P)-dependent oxidoreductase [Sphingobacterium sp.]|jgi:NAD(P)-dependent dehydrogenase (short-subunit alcohol dehydrogenase family)|nr:SDR family NAD(P)-dependent oxidoreductase [Sphingobacterium sp.]
MEIHNANVVSYVRMIQRVLPQMKELGWGKGPYTSAGIGYTNDQGAPHYSAMLAARHNLVVSLARKLKETGITTYVVSYGTVEEC